MVLKKDRRALARLMTLVENDTSEAIKALRILHKHTGNAHLIGVTGPPGGGKSTIVDRLAKELRSQDKTVGIVAVDPTSPFTGGALLGDRIRMSELTMDKGVFIRSMGTRGNLGGVARATSDVVKLLDAFGKDTILIETVGAGQAEVDIVKIAHTIIIVTVPGLGDDIQAIKAGIMEIGDIFAVNKADRGEADRKVREIMAMLELGPTGSSWKPPVIKTTAKDGEGIKELLDESEKHFRWLKESGLKKEKDVTKSRDELFQIIGEKIERAVIDRVDTLVIDGLSRQVAERSMDPYTAASEILTIAGLSGKE